MDRRHPIWRSHSRDALLLVLLPRGSFRNTPRLPAHNSNPSNFHVQPPSSCCQISPKLPVVNYTKFKNLWLDFKSSKICPTNFPACSSHCVALPTAPEEVGLGVCLQCCLPSCGGQWPSPHCPVHARLLSRAQLRGPPGPLAPGPCLYLNAHGIYILCYKEEEVVISFVVTVTDITCVCLLSDSSSQKGQAMRFWPPTFASHPCFHSAIQPWAWNRTSSLSEGVEKHDFEVPPRL